jgi:hypothetical protein
MRGGQQRYATVAATGDLALQVDAIQYRTGEGPCLEAMTKHHVLRTDDLANDARWPVFGRLATDTTGVSSMMSHRLFIEDGEPLGSLNLYSRKSAAFAAWDVVHDGLQRRLNSWHLRQFACQTGELVPTVDVRHNGPVSSNGPGQCGTWTRRPRKTTTAQPLEAR